MGLLQECVEGKFCKLNAVLTYREYLDDYASEETKKLIDKSIEIFTEEENIVSVKVPVTVCGDIHGQFHDLMEMFKIFGKIHDSF